MFRQSLFFIFAKNVTTKFEKIPRMSRQSLKTFFQEDLHSVSHPITCFCFSSWQPDAPPIIPLATVLMPPPCGVNALAMKAAQRLEPQPQSVWIKKTKLKDKLRYHREGEWSPTQSSSQQTASEKKASDDCIFLKPLEWLWWVRRWCWCISKGLILN